MAAPSHVLPFLSPASSVRVRSGRGRTGGLLHPHQPPHQGEGQERRRQALLRLLQDPREPLRRRRAPHLLEPRRHRPRPRRSRGGAAGVGLRAQDLLPDRGHAPRGDPRWQPQVRARDKGGAERLHPRAADEQGRQLGAEPRLQLLLPPSYENRLLIGVCGLGGLIVLCHYARKPAVIMIVGVNGSGETTSLGKLAYRFKNEGVKEILLVLDGTTGLNMLQQAREFNDVVESQDSS